MAKPSTAKKNTTPSAPKTASAANGSSKKPGPKPGLNLPPGKKASVQIEKTLEKLQKLVERTDKWAKDDAGLVEEATSTLRRGVACLHESSDAFKGLPDDYKTRTARWAGGQQLLEPGQTVRITEKRVADYDGILGLENLQVVETRGSKVVVLDPNGPSGPERAIVPRGHLTHQQQAQASA